MTSPLRTALAALAASALAASAPAWAGAPGATPPDGAPATAPCAPPVPQGHRELAGHVFLPSRLLVDPFSVTSVGSFTASVSGKAQGPVYDLRLPPGPAPGETKWYPYFGLAQLFTLDARLHEHLSLSLGAGGGAITGTGSGSGSALVVGTEVQAFYSGLVKGSWALGADARAAAFVGADYGPAWNVLLLQGLADAVGSGSVDPDTFLDASETLTWRIGASGAWSPSRAVGLTGQLEFQSPRKIGSASVARNGLRLAGGADYDLRTALPEVPLALALAYAWLTPVGSNGVSARHSFGLGLHYSGRKDLALGLELNALLGKLQRELVSREALAWLVLRYYW